MIRKKKALPGKPQPYGVSARPEGTNFCLYSGQSKQATLCLFKNGEPYEEYTLSSRTNKTGNVWHICISDISPDVTYGWRLQKKKGQLFEAKTLLLDPYAKAVNSPIEWGKEGPYIPQGVVIAEDGFDWQDDKPLKLPLEELVVYEMHVRGFTRSPSSNVKHPGTFLGVIEKIPYLRDLGITAVKLMPLNEFNEQEYSRFNPFSGQKLCNYWGYSTVNYFSPMNRYASSDALGQSVKDFKTMVKEFHKNGIEVILDVVFNHTAEGDDQGPIYSFKGIDSEMYYLIDQSHHQMNFTGCGNTVNCNHPVVREFIRDALKYWVTEMHVDGFRFDLAAIFTRGIHGEPLPNPPLIEELSHDPILSKTKLIAEPWDLGLYQLGKFYPNNLRWQEWNDKYRDAARRFIKGDKGGKKEFAGRIAGSHDIFASKGSPLASINFITAHDGFTLRDLVSYNHKNNTANGENDRDGNPNNVSWNCGAEGETDNPEVLSLRNKQRRNFHLALMISQGIPMLLMGDEYGHTRFGNNNPWCQDNELNWFRWDWIGKDPGFHRFYKGLIQFRRSHPVLRQKIFLNEEVDWHGMTPFNADWDGTSVLSLSLKDPQYHLYAAFNPQNFGVKLTVAPPPENHHWGWVANTSNQSPDDFFEEYKPLEGDEIEMPPYSSLLLKSKPK